MANRIRTGDPHRFNKGLSSKFHECSQVQETPDEGRRTYRPKHCGNSNKDEGNSPKTLNDKNQIFDIVMTQKKGILKRGCYENFKQQEMCLNGSKYMIDSV